MVSIHITNFDNIAPTGKLADAELHFTDGILAGHRLIGFAIWERRDGTRTVTYPARTYSVSGERRSYALLRPLLDTDPDILRNAIIDAYDTFASK